MSSGVHRTLLSLPSACWVPTFASIEPHVACIMRNLMEDPVTLSGWMESEIRNFFTQRSARCVSRSANTLWSPSVRIT